MDCPSPVAVPADDCLIRQEQADTRSVTLHVSVFPCAEEHAEKDSEVFATVIVPAECGAADIDGLQESVQTASLKPLTITDASAARKSGVVSTIGECEALGEESIFEPEGHTLQVTAQLDRVSSDEDEDDDEFIPRAPRQDEPSCQPTIAPSVPKYKVLPSTRQYGPTGFIDRSKTSPAISNAGSMSVTHQPSHRTTPQPPEISHTSAVPSQTQSTTRKQSGDTSGLGGSSRSHTTRPPGATAQPQGGTAAPGPIPSSSASPSAKVKVPFGKSKKSGT
ncbi:hypothetical protein OH77DRAFT_444573 [Trametes cingulata]|nr:hypothetical protein OH77DRAFT_444573 [Trametes cingulata]